LNALESTWVGITQVDGVVRVY